MRRIALAILVAATGGIIGVFVATQLSGQAAAAPSPAQVVVTGPLDGAGNVKVHEQATANVNVTNGSLPISGTVNVGNFPAAPTGSLTSLTFTNGLSQFVNTSSCRHVSIMVKADPSPSSSFNLKLFVSPDGSTRISLGDPGTVQGNADGLATDLIENMAIAEPFLQVQLLSGANPEGWIWCQP